VENRALPLAGGLGGVALLAFALNPWSSQNGSAPQVPIQPEARIATTPASPATPTVYSLSHNEQGPWYALCRVFATTDPEDIETTPNHPTRPESGVEEHPLLYPDAEHRPEEIKEESITSNGVQRKFIPHYHFQANLSSCLPRTNSSDDKGSRLPLNFMTATIPDPLGSHLALQFDRDIVSLERAAEATGFVFERYWFPWNGLIQAGQNAHADSQADSLRQQLREQPGILIFRHFAKTPDPKGLPPFSSRLIIFLVGETPTGGINKVAFMKAIHYTTELACFSQYGPDWSNVSPPPGRGRKLSAYRLDARTDSSHKKTNASCTANPKLAILGPSFSGSFSSLYRTLHDLRQHNPTSPSFASIISPNTTVRAIRETFSRELTDEHLGTIRTLSPLDGPTLDNIMTYLGSLGYHDREVAYLSEDESSYAPGDTNLSGGGDHKVDLLTYPRDLSSLRNVWLPTSASITPADISGGYTANSITPFSLHETASNELDSPPAFALDEAAPDIDQALSNLITVIRHRRYRVIVITATNPLDEMYLLQYVRQNAPDVRLVTYDQDSLMLRATNYVRLRGTLSITPFPLSSTRRIESVDATGFTNSAAEAMYIGARLFLGAREKNNAYPFATMGPDVVHDNLSHVATQLQSLPGIYVLGNDSFWPIKDDVTRKGSFLSHQAPLVPWTWYIIVTAFVIFACLHLSALWRVYKGPSVSGNQRIPPIPRQRLLAGSRYSEQLIMDYFRLVGNNQLLILVFFLALPSLVLYHDFTRTGEEQYFVQVVKCGLLASLPVATVLLFAASVLLFIRIVKTISTITAKGSPVERTMVRASDLISVVIYLVVTIAIWSAVILAHGHDAFHTAFRTVYLLDGLSPLPVAASVIAAWYLFAVMGVRSARTMIVMRVEPIILSSGNPASPENWVTALGEAQRKLLDEVEAFIRVNGKGLLIILFNFLGLFALQGWTALRGIDVWWFRGWLVFAGIGLMTSTIAIQFFRVWSVWTRLRSLLTVLGSCPIGPGFEDIPENIGSSKFWCSLESRQSHAFQKYTLELLRRVHAFAPSPIQETLEPYLEVASSQVDKLLYKVSEDGGEILSDQLLLNACFDAPLCFSAVEANLGQTGDPINTTGDGGDLSSDGCIKLGSWFQEKCEQGDVRVIAYAAIRYVALIKYVNTQMRWMLEFILYAYVLLILGLKTYPFQGERVIGSVLTIIFTVLFVVSAIMFIQIDSNDLLSHLEHTTPGKANYLEAAQRLLSVGGLPLIAILATQFPVIERFLLSWVKPTLESLH
jgi:hypothetical protein